MLRIFQKNFCEQDEEGLALAIAKKFPNTTIYYESLRGNFKVETETITITEPVIKIKSDNEWVRVKGVK